MILACWEWFMPRAIAAVVAVRRTVLGLRWLAEDIAATWLAGRAA